MRPGFLKGLFMGGALGVVIGMAMAPEWRPVVEGVIDESVNSDRSPAVAGASARRMLRRAQVRLAKVVRRMN